MKQPTTQACTLPGRDDVLDSYIEFLIVLQMLNFGHGVEPLLYRFTIGDVDTAVYSF